MQFKLRWKALKPKGGDIDKTDQSGEDAIRPTQSWHLPNFSWYSREKWLWYGLMDEISEADITDIEEEEINHQPVTW